MINEKISFLTEIYQRLNQTAGPHINPKIPALVFLRSFFGMFFSFYMTGMVLNVTPNVPPEFNENAFDHFVDIYLHGVISDKNPEKPGESL
jgi:hypothetical protein